ncbi:hypothetical protein B0H14DRAFT_1020816 [Mycena olivaceomarginata]|nr:hypothetical protein B0H14DRAFT_1020816 [Mycena olivaceomarginata]
MSDPPGPDSSQPVSLPPDILRQLHVARLVFACTTAVFIWDVLHNLVDDYHLFFKHKFRVSAAAYLGSRTASLAYVLGFTLFSTYPLANCRAAMVVFNSFYSLSAGCTSLLFFFRVRAIYGGQRIISWIFAFLWICVVGAAILVPIYSYAASVGSVCIVTKIPSIVGAAATALTVHDTSVFVAISYRLLANSHREHTPTEMMRALFRGANLHTFSTALFRDGQMYYMITILSNILTISLVYAPSVSPIYHGVMGIPNVTLTSIMACRVYRNAKLHYVHVPHLSLPTLSPSRENSAVIVP